MNIIRITALVMLLALNACLDPSDEQIALAARITKYKQDNNGKLPSKEIIEKWNHK